MTSVVATAAPAHAGYGCPGDWDIKRDFLDDAGRLAASTQVHESASGWCVQVVSKGPYAGVSKYMRVRVCDSFREACKEEAGKFETYVGPVYYDYQCVWVRSTSYDGKGGQIMDHWDAFGCD